MKRFYLSLAVLSLIILSASVCFAQEINYEHKIVVDQMTFEWSLAADHINVKLSAKTSGWVGIGFNPTHAMKGADFYIGYIQDGKAKIINQFGESKFHHADYKNSSGGNEMKNVTGKESGGTTEIAFTIPLKSEANPASVIKTDGAMKVLLAYGPGMKSFSTKHKFRTGIKVDLTSGKYKQLD